MRRKIISIQIYEGPLDILIFAVCNDGTLWEYSVQDNDWKRLKDIPQDPLPLKSEGDGRPPCIPEDKK